MDYVTAIGFGFPNVQVSCTANPYNFSDIVWEGGEPMPSQLEVDAWILNHPYSTKEYSILEFRRLFTFEERCAIDYAPFNAELPLQVQSAVRTMLEDQRQAEFITFMDPDTVAAVDALIQFGLITPQRASKIKAGEKPQ